MTQNIALNLKNTVISDPQLIVLPTLYHDRTGHILSPDVNPLQCELMKLLEYTNIHEMKLNPIKTIAMIFNSLKKKLCHPQIKTRYKWGSF